LFCKQSSHEIISRIPLLLHSEDVLGAGVVECAGIKGLEVKYRKGDNKKGDSL